ncbi:MAG: PfkB family carbohydrate kinase [Pseudomonadota bacterium]|nr:PfkB family carbohydrate kinase [Pseudomonadota bacterium]
MNRSPPTGPRRILGVGIATLDIINEVATYPAEDDEVRALGQRRCRGGNATNTLVVLSQLGHACALAGTLADDVQSGEILRDLKAHGVDIEPCVRHAGSHTPTSYVTLSRASGSRTIVHHRDLPELRAAELAAVDLAGYDWVHFEGRNPGETAAMIRDCVARRPDLEISVEVEKPRPGIERLLQGPQVLLFSRAYARSCGYEDPEPFLADQWPWTGAQLLVLPWGEDGAFAQVRDGPVCFAPPYAPSRVTDTLGAGDVFNAAVIDGLLAGLDLARVLGRANRLAGVKCGLSGLKGLVMRARKAGLL